MRQLSKAFYTEDARIESNINIVYFYEMNENQSIHKAGDNLIFISFYIKYSRIQSIIYIL